MTKRPDREIPAYLLERLFKGELPEAQARALQAELDQRPGGAEQAQDNLRASDEAILMAYPADKLAADIQRRAHLRAKPKTRVWALPAFAVAAAGAFALVLLLQSPSTNTVSPSSLQNPEIIGLKGLQPHLLVYRKHVGAPQRLTAQDRVRPGDVLQLAYVVPPDPRDGQPPFGAIVSLDANRTTTLHFPATAGIAEPLKTQGETRLPNAYELDNAPGFERFVLVLSKQRFNTHDVMSALQAGTALPAGLAQYEITLTKELP